MLGPVVGGSLILAIVMVAISSAALRPESLPALLGSRVPPGLPTAPSHALNRKLEDPLIDELGTNLIFAKRSSSRAELPKLTIAPVVVLNGFQVP